MSEQRTTILMVSLGVLIALALIAFSNAGTGFGSPELTRYFAAHPPDPADPPFDLPRISMPQAPPDLLHALEELQMRLSDGRTAAALTPTVAGPRVEVRVSGLRRSGDQMIVSGSVRNLGNRDMTIPPSAFVFRDSRGTRYTTEASESVTLTPGEMAAFEFTIPLPPDRGLTLMFDLPPDPPLEQILALEVVE
ncbi:MAG: hypothetical protein ACUVSW_10635 [Roseiflexus sp.]